MIVGDDRLVPVSMSFELPVAMVEDCLVEGRVVYGAPSLGRARPADGMECGTASGAWFGV
jgi:hypothetical protein